MSVESYRISLTGIQAAGRHGANPNERDVAQEFVIDLDVVVDIEEDSLDATADYRYLANAARETVERESFVLLESLAEGVAKSVYQFEPVRSVTAVVHKPGAAASMGIGDVSAEAVIA